MALALDTEKESLRGRALDAARRHKASWIELGQVLSTIFRDKLYREWGYLAFETYCQKELGIKQTTAAKLVKSYGFLEKEEPRVLAQDFREEEEPRKMPSFESVHLLRLARQNKNVTPGEFAELRESVIAKAKEPQEVRAQLAKFLQAKEDEDPAAARRQKRNTALRRLVSLLTGAKRALEGERLLPAYLLKQIADLTEKLQDQIED